MASAFSLITMGGCNVFYDVDDVRPYVEQEDIGASDASDAGSQNNAANNSTNNDANNITNNTANNAANNTSNNAANNATNNLTNQPDMGGMDAGADVGDAGTATDACVPESDQAFCARIMVVCGNASRLDNCGTVRTAPCGTCAQGTLCVQGRCEETNCRNAADDDVDGMSDCDDPDCEGLICGPGNRTCSGGLCN